MMHIQRYRQSKHRHRFEPTFAGAVELVSAPAIAAEPAVHRMASL